jgi:hypothetical protein
MGITKFAILFSFCTPNVWRINAQFVAERNRRFINGLFSMAADAMDYPAAAADARNRA